MPLQVLLGLILCNAIWATNPSMGKLVMEDFSPLHVSWLRYSSAFLSALFLVAFLRVTKSKEISPLREILKRENIIWLALIGVFTFVWSPYAQYTGLALSTSTANALIVAMEPLFAVLLAWIFLREKLNRLQIFAFLVALAGFSLLSSLNPHDLRSSFMQFNKGNIFLLLVMPAEAMYTIFCRKLVHRLTPLSIFTTALSIGFVLFTALLLAFEQSLPDLHKLHGKTIWAVLWMGPLGTTITYAYWSMALKKAPVAAVALTLFVQPILGAFAGTFFLGERLDFWQKIGGALILVALFIQTKLSLGRPHE